MRVRTGAREAPAFEMYVILTDIYNKMVVYGKV